MKQQIEISGHVHLCCYNADGSIAWTRDFHNGVTRGGLDYLGQVGFTAGTQITPWYAGLINSTPSPSLAYGDTISSHSGWSEFTGYSGNRSQWVNAQAGQIVSSTGSFSWPITSNGSVSGLFFIGGSGSATKGGTTGTLWSTALQGQAATVAVGQVLTGRYSLIFTGA